MEESLAAADSALIQLQCKFPMCLHDTKDVPIHMMASTVLAKPVLQEFALRDQQL
jgi:hypothetical protein